MALKRKGIGCLKSLDHDIYLEITMILKVGEKIHVIVRRVFFQDIRRHFIGEVTDVTESLVRAEGHAYLYDTNTNLFVRKNYVQTRIISLVDAANIITVLPSTTNLKKIVYRHTEKKRMVLTDGEALSMDVNEFGVNR
jgi:hypothetical protein